MQIDKAYIEEFDVIRRYQQNKLSEEELNSFEIYILENPDIINVLEQEKILHDAFREHEPLLKPGKEKSISLFAGRGMALAACLVLGVVAVFNFSGNQSSYELQPPVVLETFRGAADNTVQLSGQPILQFQVDMGPAEFLDSNSFTAELVDASGSSLFRSAGLSVDADGWLFYSLDAQAETLQGNYQLKVYPDAQSSNATSYSLEFTVP